MKERKKRKMVKEKRRKNKKTVRNKR